MKILTQSAIQLAFTVNASGRKIGRGKRKKQSSASGLIVGPCY